MLDTTLPELHPTPLASRSRRSAAAGLAQGVHQVAHALAANCANKSIFQDLNPTDVLQELDLVARMPHYVPISAKDEWNFDELMEKIWDYLDLIRIYTKPKGQIPDYDQPVIMPRSRSTVIDFCGKLHKTLIKEFKCAQVWGTSAKHNPQKVGKDH